MTHAELKTVCRHENLSIKTVLVHQIVLVIGHRRRRGANAKCAQLKYAIEVDRCRYRTIAQPKKYCCGFIRDILVSTKTLALTSKCDCVARDARSSQKHRTATTMRRPL